jgi:hypothetical protein
VLRRHGWVRVFIRDFEGNPRTQYRFHKWATRFWLANAAAVVAVFTFAPALWGKISVLYLVLVSLYANAATDAGAMAAANASTGESVTAYAIEADAAENQGGAAKLSARETRACRECRAGNHGQCDDDACACCGTGDGDDE